MMIVVDYGSGNLRSVSKAIEHLGGTVKVSSSPTDILQAEKLVLPGVGAFGNAVQEIQRRNLFQPLLEFLHRDKPFLGICVGLQLLFEESEESPGIPGLGFLPGKVRAFQSQDIKIPQMGWNSVKINSPHPLLQDVADESYFYFVHSYYAIPSDGKIAVGICEYGQDSFAAIVGRKNVFATQFHPEKSQESGLKILRNFIKW